MRSLTVMKLIQMQLQTMKKVVNQLRNRKNQDLGTKRKRRKRRRRKSAALVNPILVAIIDLDGRDDRETSFTMTISSSTDQNPKKKLGNPNLNPKLLNDLQMKKKPGDPSRKRKKVIMKNRMRLRRKKLLRKIRPRKRSALHQKKKKKRGSGEDDS